MVGQSRVTVTPTNDHNASFQFLDEYNGEIADADGSLVGHQIDLGAGVTTVRIRVISPDSRATHTYTIVDRTEEIPLCTPIQGSSVDPCEPDVAQVSSNNALVDVGPEPWSVRSFLDGGRGSLFEGHLVVRGTYIPGTVRCIADNTARYPSYLGVPNNSVPEGVSQFKCYADVRVNAYVVGSGPSTLTVLVRAFGYWSNATPEAIERLRSYYERVFIEGGYLYKITVPAGGIGGREAMLFLGPAIDVSIESWRVYTTWDVQRREDGTVVAVHPDRDYWRSRADYQTYRSAVEMELPVFTQAATAAHQARLTEYGGRIGLEENLPMLVSDANQLRQYYNEVGAYSHPEGPPSQPPPVYAPAPASLTATASGETTELGEESADLSWSSRDRSIRLPCPAPHQRSWRAVVHSGRERDGDYPHGVRPVVRQDARVQGGRTRRRDNLQREGGAVVPYGDCYHGGVQPSASEVQSGLLLVGCERRRNLRLRRRRLRIRPQ